MIRCRREGVGRTRTAALVLLVAVVVTAARPQDSLYYRTRIAELTDSTQAAMRSLRESSHAKLSETCRAQIQTLAHLADSLLGHYRDSLSLSRKDSLVLVQTALAHRLDAVGQAYERHMAALESGPAHEIPRLRNQYLPCTDCESQADYRDRLAEFNERTDSLVEAYRDSLDSILAASSDAVSESGDMATDSLQSTVDQLVDNEQEEREYEEENASRLVFASGYMSRVTFRGRDNGVEQYGFMPSAVYRHRWGISVGASTHWLSQARTAWDEVDVLLGFDKDFDNGVGIAVGYTRFFFNDSSIQERSLYTSNLYAEVDIETRLVTISPALSLDIGSTKELTMMLGISRPITFSRYPMTLTPAVTAVWGDQNLDLISTISKKIKKQMKKQTVTQTVTQTTTKQTSFFSIMDYEVAIPLTLRLGIVEFTPMITYVIPVNVYDGSQSSAFFFFGSTLTVTVR